MTVYQTFRGLAICLLVSGSYALATAQDAREPAYLRTGRLPYAGPPAPLPYADPPALLPYADLATPLPYAGPPVPLPYAGPTTSLPHAGPTRALPYAGPTRALPYAGPTVPPDADPTVPPSYTDWFSEVMGTKEPCVEYCSACPRVYAYGEFLFLQRSNCSRNQPMILALPPNSFDEETFFSTSDLSFDYDPAFRVLVGRRLHDGWALEASYFGLWSAASKPCLAAPDGNTQLIFPAPFGNLYSPVDRVWIRYSSAIQSGELNVTGLFRLTDVWNLRAGDNVMHIGGLAPAPDQLDFGVAANSGQQLHQTGGIFLHGFNLGFEARW